jgi:site-specific DNA-methyltransferase (adenine-specific)
LLLTIANNLKQDVSPIGVDRDRTGFHLAETMFDLMQYPDHLYFQDTFTFHDVQADAIVTDFPFSKPENKTYFPYEVIRFHQANLRPGGYFLGIVPNDFFEVEGNQAFHEIVQSLYQIIGLVKLPDTMFKAMGKSVLILQKRDEWVRPLAKVLLAEIPSFQDPKAVNEAIRRIDAWFMENIKPKEEDN